MSEMAGKMGVLSLGVSAGSGAATSVIESVPINSHSLELGETLLAHQETRLLNASVMSGKIA